MEPVKPLETPEHQEARAQKRLRISAALITAAILGLYFMVFSRGFPWLGTSFLDAAVGRITGQPWWLNFLLHAGACTAYSFAIGLAVYRFNPLIAALVGIAMGFVLYGVNFVLAQAFGMKNPGEEGGVLIAHLFFGLFGALIYKAFSVPPPLGVKKEARIS